MRIIYFGTPGFSAEILKTLIHQNVSIAAVVTQPDRPRGRKQQIAPSAVKKAVLESSVAIPILQPIKASQPEFLDCLEKLKADLYVVVAYGQILSRKLLQIPPLGCINVHTSLLPKYRGAAPIQRCLMNGDVQTGVCVQKMVFQLDAGDIIDAAKMAIPSDMTFGELERALCNLAKPLLLSVLRCYEEKGLVTAVPQDEQFVTYAAKITPAECQIQWTRKALEIHHLVHALSPRPGAWAWIEWGGQKKRLKILRTRLSDQNKVLPGTLLIQKERCFVGCGEGVLELLEVQLEGKRTMAVAEWLIGCREKSLLFVSTQV